MVAVKTRAQGLLKAGRREVCNDTDHLGKIDYFLRYFLDLFSPISIL